MKICHLEDGVLTLRRNNPLNENEVLAIRSLGFSLSGPHKRNIDIKLKLTDHKAILQFARYIYPGIQKKHPDMWKQINDAIYVGYKKVADDFMAEFGNKLPTKTTEDGITYSLRPKQIQGLRTFVYRKYNAPCWEMACGKSITSAAISMLTGVKRTIILTSAISKWNWYYDLQEWGVNGLNITVLDSDRNNCEMSFGEKFVVVNYDILDRKDIIAHLLSTDCQHIIMDEVHHLKNVTTGKHMGAENIVSMFPDARITAMTGTPVANRINDLWAILVFMKHYVTTVYTEDWFYEKFVKIKSGKISGVKNENLLNLIISNTISRVLTSEMWPDLPDEQIENVRISMDNYKDEFDGALHDIVSSKKELTELESQNSALLLKIRRAERDIKNTTDKAERAEKRKALLYVKSQNNDLLERINELRKESNGSLAIHTLNRIASMSKVKHAIEIAEKIIADGGKVAIFSYYTDTINTLKEHFGERAVMIDGKVSSKKRQYYVQRFQNKKSIPVFIGQEEAAGESINLTSAAHGIIMDFPFTPKTLLQVLKRLKRPGNKGVMCEDGVRRVLWKFMIADGSIDEAIYKILLSKISDINKTIDFDKDDLQFNMEGIPDIVYDMIKKAS